MARTSGDLVSGIGVVAEQWNREQDGDVERQKHALPSSAKGPHPIAPPGPLCPAASALAHA